MKTLLYPLLCLFFLSIATATAQQTNTKESASPAPLARQYNSLKEGSNSYRENNREYKVVNVSALDAFWRSVQQTIKATEQGLIDDKKAAEDYLAQARQTIAEQQKQIQALKLDNQEKDKQVQASLHDVNSLSVLGIDMKKQFYVILTAVIILALLVLLAIKIQQYKRSNVVAVEKLNEYNAIELELNEYKKTAREREIKLKRELQTEMNHNQELALELEQLKRHHI
ncbi:hypothetical protein [Pontibacter beigongshangensis]|uniref:hypothetical protein n=1 Tax=Pontibacter beigongshangensis TaxID=2574733 RepID=UPI0016500832|nr:hypothetical protein [Pontibacter beigongshangensis]